MSLAAKSPLRGAQYLRYSTDRYGRARSNDEQQRDNERDAELEGIRIVKTYRDPERSASRYATKAREEYKQVLHDMALGQFDVLYLWESSRGSRQVSEWAALIELADANSVLFRITSHRRTYDPKNPRDRRMLQEDAVDSEYESGKTSLRVTRASQASADDGRPWGKVPFGYVRSYDPRTGRLLGQSPDRDTAKVVKEIVRRVLAGDPISKIADDLTVRGVPTPAQYRAARRGLPVPEGSWSRSTIHTMFRSPTVVGLRLHRGLVVGSAEWDPIVRIADFEEAKRVLGSRLLRVNPGSAPKHLLSGIAECGVCGARCDRQINHGVPSYACTGQPPRPGERRRSKKHVTRAQAPLDALVTVCVVDRLRDPQLMVRLSKARERTNDDAAAAAREIADIDAQIAEFVRSASTRRGMAALAFERVIDDLTAQREAAEARLASGTDLPPVVLDIAGPDAAERWAAIQDDIVRVRLIVRSLVQVIVHPSNAPRGSRVFDESSIEIRDR